MRTIQFVSVRETDSSGRRTSALVQKLGYEHFFNNSAFPPELFICVSLPGEDVYCAGVKNRRTKVRLRFSCPDW